MNKKFKFKLTNELTLFLVLLAIIIAFGLINPTIVTVFNMLTQMRNLIVVGVLSIGMFLVMLSRGIDLSFMVIALFSQYLVLDMVMVWGVELPLPATLIVGGLVGLTLSMINVFFISKFNIQAIIVTLATQGIVHGLMFEVLDTSFFSNLKGGLQSISNIDVFYIERTGASALRLNISFLIFVGAALFVWWMLRYTMIGRNIFAVGGDPVAAERAGINVSRVYFVCYGFLGFLAGIIGMVSAGLQRSSMPNSLFGVSTEFDVIAPVVLGGAFGGGRGSVIGTILGVFILTIVKNSLVLIGVPAQAQKAVTGMIVLISLAATGYRTRKLEVIATK